MTVTDPLDETQRILDRLQAAVDALLEENRLLRAERDEALAGWHLSIDYRQQMLADLEARAHG